MRVCVYLCLCVHVCNNERCMFPTLVADKLFHDDFMIVCVADVLLVAL